MEERRPRNTHIVLIALGGLNCALEESKPDDRSEIDRRFAVVITMMEKVTAYISFFLGTYLDRVANGEL